MHNLSLITKKSIKSSIIVFCFVSATILHAETWTQLFPTGSAPTTRLGQSAIYDIANNRMTIFAGGGNPGFLNDTWVLTNANGIGGTPAWTQLAPTGGPPTLRDHQSAIYDPANNRMTIFGGYNGTYMNDVWVLSTANGLGGTPSWTQLSPTGSAPTTRCSHTVIYDSANNRMTIFAGICGTNLNDTWVLTNANGLGGTPAWTQLSPTGSIPTTRAYSTAVYDTTNNRMIIFGGTGDGGNLNDVWILTNANGISGTLAWTQLSPTGSTPTTRFGHVAIYDDVNNRMLIFGGYNNGFYLNDVWELSNANGLGGTPAWTQILPTGSLPTTRRMFSAIYDPVHTRMTIFGGEKGSGSYLNDVWVLTTTTPVKDWWLYSTDINTPNINLIK